MSNFLNKNNDAFKKDLRSEIFIDKSLLIKEINKKLGTNSSFMCVTRPRRFGKTMALSMLNAYYSKGSHSKELFDKLKICSENSYLENLNKHNVLWIDMASVYTDIDDKNTFVKELSHEIIQDLKEEYSKVLTENENTIRKCFNKINSCLNERFIFLIDEWDIIYREQGNNFELCEEYTEFLRNLFKSSDVSSCIDLVYMTGILPVRRYSTQSTLNMFYEYNMIKPRGLEAYFGFTEEEVKELCEQYIVNYEEMKKWYNGYSLKGVAVYNPKSVVDAIKFNEFDDYWIKTSAIEAVTDYMNYDNGVLKDTITNMLSGDMVRVDVLKFENDLTKVNSKDAALTVLIHLGYLAYNEEKETCYIPNYEIRKEFVEALDKLNWKEIYNPISNSEKLYEETLKGNTKFINQTLDYNHKELSGPYNKNNEDVLGVIVQISYYVCKKYYNVKKEDTSILGRADITFVPYDNTKNIPMIVELKVDSTPTDAINQIIEKEYFNCIGDYHGELLLLGVSYNKKTLKHESKVKIVKI